MQAKESVLNNTEKVRHTSFCPVAATVMEPFAAPSRALTVKRGPSWVTRQPAGTEPTVNVSGPPSGATICSVSVNVSVLPTATVTEVGGSSGLRQRGPLSKSVLSNKITLETVATPSFISSGTLPPGGILTPPTNASLTVFGAARPRHIDVLRGSSLTIELSTWNPIL